MPQLILPDEAPSMKGSNALSPPEASIRILARRTSTLMTSLCLFVAAALTAAPVAASAQTTGLQDPLLNRLIGDWVLEGTIENLQVTHDVVSEWVLGHHYVRLHEVARERYATGTPAYEAIVFIGWDQSSQRYACLWLDSTGGPGLLPHAIGYGVASGDSIPFLFQPPDGNPFHITFLYNRTSDTWEWHLDNEEDDGTRQPFARVTLTRKQ